ncbi:MAG: phosphatidate cytidylyltransferase [Microbacteriaceae bacterium]|nr:phosphatidate cytidylyltransferase [Burkholderiaceae bacterium]
MLRQRLITALVLLALLLPALFASSSLPFALFTLLLVSAAGWEWARLNGVQAPLPALATGALVALMCAASLRNLPQMGHAGGLWWAGTLLWLVGGALVLRRGPAGWSALPKGLRWALGPLLLWLAWLAMAQARTIGVNFLLSAMCVVWVADISAYFCGRAFGQRKLAITISPGKSWEGVYGGVAGVLLLSLLWIWGESQFNLDSASLFKLLQQRLGWGGLLLVALLLTALSVVGDLFESLVKRAAGAKDSSRLLPGHGGVLDRVDALLPVLPAALALISL